MKNKVVESVKKLLADKISMIQSQIETAQEAVFNETKSSAGDKYETGRAMAQNEIFRLNQQFEEIVNTSKTLNQINFELNSESITQGSLVETGIGWFLVSAGIGNVIVDGLKIITLSAHSPLGQTLLDKIKNDSFKIQNKEYKILQVL